VFNAPHAMAEHIVQQDRMTLIIRKSWYTGDIPGLTELVHPEKYAEITVEPHEVKRQPKNSLSFETVTKKREQAMKEATKHAFPPPPGYSTGSSNSVPSAEAAADTPVDVQAGQPQPETAAAVEEPSLSGANMDGAKSSTDLVASPCQQSGSNQLKEDVVVERTQSPADQAAAPGAASSQEEPETVATASGVVKPNASLPLEEFPIASGRKPIAAQVSHKDKAEQKAFEMACKVPKAAQASVKKATEPNSNAFVEESLLNDPLVVGDDAAIAEAPAEPGVNSTEVPVLEVTPTPEPAADAEASVEEEPPTLSAEHHGVKVSLESRALKPSSTMPADAEEPKAPLTVSTPFAIISLGEASKQEPAAVAEMSVEQSAEHSADAQASVPSAGDFFTDLTEQRAEELNKISADFAEQMNRITAEFDMDISAEAGTPVLPASTSAPSPSAAPEAQEENIQETIQALLAEHLQMPPFGKPRTDTDGEPESKAMVDSACAEITPSDKFDREVNGAPESKVIVDAECSEMMPSGKPGAEAPGEPGSKAAGESESNAMVDAERPAEMINSNPEAKAAGEPELQAVPDSGPGGSPDAEATQDPESKAMTEADGPETMPTGSLEAEALADADGPESMPTASSASVATLQPESSVATLQPESNANADADSQETTPIGKPDAEATGEPESKVDAEPEMVPTGSPDDEAAGEPESKAAADAEAPETMPAGSPDADAGGEPESMAAASAECVEVMPTGSIDAVEAGAPVSMVQDDAVDVEGHEMAPAGIAEDEAAGEAKLQVHEEENLAVDVKVTESSEEAPAKPAVTMLVEPDAESEPVAEASAEASAELLGAAGEEEEDPQAVGAIQEQLSQWLHQRALQEEQLQTELPRSSLTEAESSELGTLPSQQSQHATCETPPDLG